MQKKVKTSSLLLMLLLIVVLSISFTFAQDSDNSTANFTVNDDKFISIENQEYLSVNDAGCATDSISIVDDEELGNAGQIVESMPQIDTGTVSGGVDYAAVNPGTTTGNLVYTIPEGMTSLKSAIVIVNVYSGSGYSTYALNSNVTLNTNNGLEILGYEDLFLDKETTNDPNVYSINDHTNKQYSDYQMIYDITNKVNNLNSGDSITINVVDSRYGTKLFDGRIKLISLLFAYDDGDNDNYTYWLNAGQLWTQNTANFNFNTKDYAGKTDDLSLRTIALSSSAAASYKINNIQTSYDSATSGPLTYKDIKWNNVSSEFTKGSNTNFWFENGASSYKTNVALLIASEIEVPEPLTEVYVDYAGGDDNNKGNSIDAAFKTIKHALTEIEENGIIYINGINYLDGADVNGLNIDKNISIIGLGNDATIDARNSGRIFNIGYYTVNLSNLAFINSNASGTSDKRGGALWANGTALTVDNCRFINNSGGEKSYGGAINLKSSTATIVNSKFEGNTAGYGGGAINAENTNVLLNISGSTFTGNGLPGTGWAYGGAICSYNAVIIDRSIFYENNLAEGKNGRSINQYDGNLIITNSVLLDGSNSVYLKNPSDTTLENNWWGNNDTTKDTNPKQLGYTNADVTSYLYLNMTMFASGMDVGDVASVNINLVSTAGDAINVMDLPATVRPINGLLNKDSVTLVDGVGSVEYTITVVGNNSVTVDVLGIKDSYFLSSSDVVSTKVIHVNSTGGSDANSGVDWNNAVQTIEKALSIVDVNGTIFVADGLYELSDSTPVTGIEINKNVSIIGESINAIISGKNSKRIFRISKDSTLVIYNLTLTNAYAQGSGQVYGGAILIEDDGNANPTAGKLMISNSIISNSYAPYGGAIGTNRGSIDNVNNVSFINNSAGSGGALYLQQKGVITIGDNCKFINNYAEGRGSAIYAQGKVTTGKDNLFYGNIATGRYGYGAIFGWGFEIGTGNVFVNNKATTGGALYLGGSNFNGVGSYCFFINNTDDNGYPIAKQSVSRALTLDNCYWGTNTPDFSTLCNGAITYTAYLIFNIASDVNTFSVGDSALISIDLTKNQNGVAVDVDSLPSVLPLSFDVVNGNVNPANTQLVKGVATTSYSPYVMGEGSVTANIYAISEALDFTILAERGTIFVNYTGGLDTNIGDSWDTAVKTINRALEIVSDNKTIYIADGVNYLDDVGVNGLSISKNVSIIGMGDNVVIDANYNGRIFNIGDCRVSLSNLIFINGNALNTSDKRGGALWVNGTALTIANCEFINNSGGEKSYGGAINLKSSTATIIDSKFEGNTAGYGGGAINAENTNVLLNISGSTFTGNGLPGTGWVNGGAICSYNAVIIDRSIFYENNLAEGKNGRSINQYDGNLIITNSVLLDGSNSVYLKNPSDTTLENNWWGNNDTTKDTNPKQLGYTNADVNSYLVLSSKIRQEKVFMGDSVSVVTTLENNVVNLPLILDVNMGSIYPNETNLIFKSESIYNASALGDMVITIDVLGIKNEIKFTVKETLPNVDISQVKTQWSDGIYPEVNNTFTITLNNAEDGNVEGLVLEVYSNETGELIASYAIDSLICGSSSISITDPTIRPATEQTVWPTAQNNKIKFTFNLMRGEDLVSTLTVDKMLAYNGYFNKTYVYNGHSPIINRNYTISGDIIIATQDVSVYMDQYSRYRKETWNIVTPENAEIVKVLLYFNYNWDTSFYPNEWSLTFNEAELVGTHLIHEIDRGNLGGWGAYNYGLLVFDVTDYFNLNGENSFIINKTGNCALYPSTLFVLYNETDSSSVKDVYFSDICDVFYPNYNRQGYDDLLKVLVNYNNININDMSKATWYAFGGSGGTPDADLIFNDLIVLDAYSEQTSNDCYAYELDVTDVISQNNLAQFITTTRSSTIVAYEQVLVVERINKSPTSIAVINDTVDLLVGGEFVIGAVLSPDVGDLIYGSSDESVAVVVDGKIVAMGVGTAIVTVSFPGNENYSASCAAVDVTVNKVATVINVTNSTVVLDVGGEFVIGAVLSPDVGDLIYGSSDESVAVVVDGKIVAMGVGSAIVTVSFPGNENYSASNATVSVGVGKNFTRVNVVNDTVDLFVGDEFVIGAVLSPDVGDLIYGSSDESVAVVVDGKIVAIGDGSAIVTVSFPGNENYFPSSATVIVNVNKKSTNVKIDIVLNYGFYPGMVTVIVKSNVDGVYNVTVCDNTFEVNVADGSWYESFMGIDAGKQNVTVRFMGNEAYNESTVTQEFEILKELVPEFTVEFGKTTYPDNVAVLINGPSGTYEVKVDDEHYAVIDVGADNIGTGNITGLAAGTYVDVNVSYGGNDNIEDGFKLFTFTVEPLASSVSITPMTEILKYLDSINITYTETNGKAVIDVKNDKGKFDFIIINDTIVLTDLIPGNYTVTATICGNENITGSSDEIKFIVGKLNPTFVSVVSENNTVGKDVVITAIAPRDAVGMVSLSIDGKIVSDGNHLDENGIVIFNVSGLDAGHHSYLVSYEGDDNYVFAEDENSFDVTKTNASDKVKVNVDVPENSTDAIFGISLPEDATGYLFVDVDGKHYYAVLDKGNASITVSGLVPGNYSVNVTYSGDGKYDSVTRTSNISVSSNVPDNALSIPETSETNSPTYAVNLPNDAGGYLEVDVDGKKYVAALDNGSASITVPNLSDGEHNVTVTYTGDGKYSKVSKSTTLEVKIPIPVYAISQNQDVSALYSATASYKVLVTKDGNAVVGENVIITFNGVKSTIKTDSRGYATLKLNTNLKVKTYSITAEYNDIKVTNKVTIKNIIKAKNIIVKKSKKVTKVKVSLDKVDGKVLKSKKLTIKFKGKTYKVKTNKKGVATWNVKKSMLKKLKVGKKYKYTVTYGKDVVTKKLTVKR